MWGECAYTGGAVAIVGRHGDLGALAKTHLVVETPDGRGGGGNKGQQDVATAAMRLRFAAYGHHGLVPSADELSHAALAREGVVVVAGKGEAEAEAQR